MIIKLLLCNDAGEIQHELVGQTDDSTINVIDTAYGMLDDFEEIVIGASGLKQMEYNG